jgi:hypothetical protein
MSYAVTTDHDGSPMADRTRTEVDVDETTVPGFLPSTSGLHFSNSWPPGTPALVVRTPLGALRIGDASRGLCGGMVLAAADLSHAGRTPPARTDSPPAGSPAIQYLTKRLLDSWDLPEGPTRYYRWMLAGDEGSSGTWQRTAAGLPGICSVLDSGRLCPLGVVTVHSWKPTDLGANHQVLAYGYRRDDDAVTLRVYDPNQPDDDAVALRCDTAGRQAPEGHLDLPHATRGLFRIGWSPHDPAPLFRPDDSSVATRGPESPPPPGR